MRFGIPSAGMVGKQGVAAPVSSRLVVCQPCFMCQLLHHCVNASLLLYTNGVEDKVETSVQFVCGTLHT
jgi:uncharacterized membrane protein